VGAQGLVITLAPAQNPQRLVPQTAQSHAVQQTSNFGAGTLVPGANYGPAGYLRRAMAMAIASLIPSYQQPYVNFIPRFKPSTVVMAPTISIASLPSAAQNTPATSITPSGDAAMYPSLWDLTA
jgi:hypothetical protein